MVWKYCSNCRREVSKLHDRCPGCGGELKNKADDYSKSKGAFRKKTNSKSIRRKSSPRKRGSK